MGRRASEQSRESRCGTCPRLYTTREPRAREFGQRGKAAPWRQPGCNRIQNMIRVGDSYDEVYTGELLWVDAEENPLGLTEIGPVAYSEGVLMASSIYAGRKQDDDGEEE